MSSRIRALAPVVCAIVFVATLAPAAKAMAAADVARYQPPTPPPLSAKAAFVVDITSGTELFALNPDTPLPPASLTKIVSALVILERVNLDDTIEIVEEDRVSPEESQVGLVVGDQLSARDLLYGALIPSGNDATRALARHVGGGQLNAPGSPEQALDAFVALMNAKAQELGASASHFENATGMDADGHVMSARDVATVAAIALRDPLFAEIVSTPSTVLPSEVLPDGYAVQTTNQLLLEGYASGVKTGTTPAAGGCLATSFTVGPNQVVAVVLGSALVETTDGAQDSTARFAETRAIRDAVTTQYTWLDPAAPGVFTGLPEELLVWQVGLADGGLLPVPSSEVAQLRYRLVLEPPAAPRAPAGEVQFYVGERLLSERDTIQTG